MSKRKKRRGHFCWCCRRVLPNERFSGKGHRRHVCKQCQRFGHDELEVRQRQRDIDRLLDWSGRIKRKQRGALRRYLEHDNPQVRAYAELVARQDAEIREQIRKEWEQERASYENPDAPKIEEREGPQAADSPFVDDLDLPF